MNKLPIRFFVIGIDETTNELDYFEVDEAEFIASKGDIEYQRHTLFENGVDQVCLYKDNGFAD